MTRIYQNCDHTFASLDHSVLNTIHSHQLLYTLALFPLFVYANVQTLVQRLLDLPGLLLRSCGQPSL